MIKFSPLAFLAFWLPFLGIWSSEVAATAVVPSEHRATLFAANANSTAISIESPQRRPLKIAQQDYTAVRGTKVSLIPPAGFTPADTFSGFQQLDTGASILVSELPVAYAQIADDFTAANLKSRGMTLIAQENVNIYAGSGQLIHVEQVADYQNFTKLILVFGDEDETVLLTAAMPKELEKTLFQSLKKSLLTAKWEPDKAVDSFADLPFVITSTPALKFSDRLINCLAYTEDGMMPIKSATAPMLVACQSIGRAQIGDREQFAKARIAKTALIENISIESSKAIDINGLDAYEIIATANHSETKEPLVIYQVLLFDRQTYYIIQGRVGSKLRSQYLDDFQTMAMSFQKRTKSE